MLKGNPMQLSHLGFNLGGSQTCKQCQREFSLKDVQTDPNDIEYNAQTLYMDSLCSKSCAIALQGKDRGEHRRDTIESLLYKRCNVPKLFLECSFDNFNPGSNMPIKHAIKVLKRLTEPWSDFVVLVGNPGTGKTHLAVALIRKIIEEQPNFYPYFISALHLLSDIKKATLSEHPKDEEQIISFYVNKRVLVIDDIGVEKTSPFVNQTWYRIIDDRYANSRATVFTSNLSNAELSEKLEPRLISRIFSGITLPTAGDDFRSRGKMRAL
ncbi:MAG: AAA family ATPase [Chitinivibrionales bacterium]|nr:AAA family ATPase [Chitinivibrionales bacterium]